MDANTTTPACPAPPAKRPRRKHAKRVGEDVDVRLAPGVWTQIPKPRSRRGKNYVEHVREILERLTSGDEGDEDTRATNLHVGLEILSVRQMSSTGMVLSECIFFAATTNK